MYSLILTLSLSEAGGKVSDYGDEDECEGKDEESAMLDVVGRRDTMS